MEEIKTQTKGELLAELIAQYVRVVIEIDRGTEAEFMGKIAAGSLAEAIDEVILLHE